MIEITLYSILVLLLLGIVSFITGATIQYIKIKRLNKQKQYWKRYGEYRRKHNEALKNSIKNN